MKIVQLKSGFHVLEDNCIGAYQVQSGELCHDRHLVPYATSQFEPGSNVIDVGALCGDHSLEYSQRIGDKGGMLIAIEPCLAAFDCLRFNLQIAPCRCICINAAASDSHGTVLYHKMNDDNVGASTVEVLQSERTDPIRSVSIDGLLKDAGIEKEPIHFIKIDVEGFENRVLQGARQTLATYHPKLMIEINEAKLKDNGATPLDVYNFLVELGYEWKIIQPQCKAGDPQYDILACEKMPEPLPVSPEGV